LGLCDAEIVVQTEPATETFPGAVAEGFYELIDGKVVVTGLQGSLMSCRPAGRNPSGALHASRTFNDAVADRG
jgi:hypothetical protein